MTRFVSVCGTIAAVLAMGTPEPAHADSGMLPNGAVLQFQRLYIFDDGERIEPSTDELREYLNFAHCACSQAMAGDETSVVYEVSLIGDTNTNRAAEIWVGTQCDDDVLRATNCRMIDTIPDIDVLSTRIETIEVPLYDVINGTTPGACRAEEGTATLWVLFDSDGDTTYDYFNTEALGQVEGVGEVSGFDNLAPPLGTEFTADSAESAVRIEWTVPESRATDIFYYQALCADADGNPVLEDPPSPRYETPRTLCGAEQDILFEETDIESGGTTVTLPAPFAQLDPAYLCGDSADPTAAGILIEGLENDVPYTVAVLAIDRNGNPAGMFLTRTITPRPATDFWEDLHDRGSNVEGGFCLLAETYGDGNPLTQALRGFRDGTLASSGPGRALIEAYYASTGALGEAVHGSLALRVIAAIVLAPLVAIALVWHALTLPGLLALGALGWLWRRHRRRRVASPLARHVATAASATLALLVLVPAAAHAQGPTPFWEDTATPDEAEDTVDWHAGIRVGPYVPDIDKQFGMEPGPYADMFGGYQVLPMIDVDRILWRGFGQLGVGGSIGYMQKSGNAWADGSSPTDPMRPRSEGDTTTFRLLPFALTAVYRFTWFDERFGVPIVPYVRGGVSYYTWWIRTNGKTATACFDGTRDPDCDQDKAIGATVGLQGSIGLAIRAERVDAAAAASMRAGGIMHAGFYAELSLAKVDGFGSDEKLSVGDATWFAGVDFEF